MLGKLGGGSRTISKTPMLYRITFRSRKEVEEWEDENTGSFDTVGKGRSALIAVAYRNLEAEVYSCTEEQVIGVLHVMVKFSDTIDIPVLINTAYELGFPLLDMVLSMHPHLAPRTIQCEGFCGEPVLITKSI